MKSRVLKLASLALALMMVICLFSACGKDTGESSNKTVIKYEYEYEYVDENGNPITEDGAPVEENDKDTGSKKGSTGKNNSSKKGASGSGSGSGSGATEVVTGKTKFEADPYSDIPASLKGSTVKVLLWRDPWNYDITLKDGFEAKTGIKVEYIVAKGGNYSTQLATLISSGDSPDVVNMGSDAFPSFAIASLEPLDKEVFRLDDPIWNKDLMDSFKINGKYYALAIPGSWYNDDLSYVSYYNPATLQACGISTESMPYNLWKSGNWNINKLEEIIRKVDSMGSAYTGLSIQTEHILNPYMLSAGVDYVKYSNNEFSSNITNTKVVEMSEKLAGWYEDGLVSGWLATGIGDQTLGIFDAISFGMGSTVEWFSIPHSEVDVAPIAGNYTPASPKVWGVAKGAKNAQGAAYFLRYFLDPASLDMASTFATPEMYEVWKYTTSGRKQAMNMTRGLLNYYDSSAYGTLSNKVSTSASAQIGTVLGQYENTINAACKRANKDIKKALAEPSYLK